MWSRHRSLDRGKDRPRRSPREWPRGAATRPAPLRPCDHAAAQSGGARPVGDIKSWKPRTLRLTHAWAGQAVDLLREMRGQPERRTAFEFLVGESASDQLSAMEHDIRVRGRLRWSVGPVVADAMRGCLWIGLPQEASTS